MLFQCPNFSGSGQPLGLHRSGCWRMATGGNKRDARLRDSQRKIIEEEHTQCLDELTNACKRMDAGAG
jgi:hypothetical protein